MALDNPTITLSLFTPDEAAQLIGASRRQLSDWARRGVLSPSIPNDTGWGRTKAYYSFYDVCRLQVLQTLRRVLGARLAPLAPVLQRLGSLPPHAWTTTTLCGCETGKVLMSTGSEGAPTDTAHDCRLQISLQEIEQRVAAAVLKSRERDPSLIGQIETKRRGKRRPMIAGTRIPVWVIQSFADEGYSVDAILEQYPTLTASDVQAAIDHRMAA
jgi:uncharacterized protein (DUF433 family)